MAAKNSVSNSSVDFGVLVYASNQGNLLHYTLRSIELAVAQTDTICNTRVFIIADAVDAKTKQYITRLASGSVEILPYNYQDFSKSINKAIKELHIEYVSIVKGGDLISPNWLSESFKTLKDSPNTIVHPEACLSFGLRDKLFIMQSLSEMNELERNNVETNPYCLGFACKREALLKSPLQSGFYEVSLYEDVWHWTCETIASGSDHRIVAKTLYADRWVRDDVRRASGFAERMIKQSGYFTTYKRRDEGPIISVKETRKAKLLSANRKMIDTTFRSRPVRFIGAKNQRLQVYLDGIRNETMHLFRPPEPIKKDRIPQWLLDQVLQMHQLDLRIFLSQYLRQNIELTTQEGSVITKTYWEIMNSMPGDIDVLWLVPYLKNGGAEREIINLIDIMLELDPRKKIVILATEPGGSPWASKLAGKAHFIEATTDFYQLSADDQARVVGLISIQSRPKKVHIVSSIAAYDALEKYSAYIAESTQIFITIFMLDVTDEGRVTHMFTDKCQYAIENVTKVFTDNKTVVDSLVNLMDIDESKFSVHYQPAQIERIASTTQDTQKRFTRSPIKVLWAGRLDRQKRPDQLVAIAQASHRANMNIEFHAYGGSAFGNLQYAEEIQKSVDVNYHGPYANGLNDLPLHDFDIFLMTSEWEGMPNVLLEAIVNGLLVIAPNVGGVGELIKNNKTGYLVGQYDDTKGYIQAIQDVLVDPAMSHKLIEAAQELVTVRHSGKAYAQLITKETEYLD